MLFRSIRRSIDEQLDHIVESIEEQRHDITDTKKELHDVLTTIAAAASGITGSIYNPSWVRIDMLPQ